MGRGTPSRKLHFAGRWAGERSTRNGEERGIGSPAEEGELGPERGGRAEEGTSAGAQKDARCRTRCVIPKPATRKACGWIWKARLTRAMTINRNWVQTTLPAVEHDPFV